MAKQVAQKTLTTVYLSPAKCRLTDEFRGRSAPVGDDDVIALADSLRTQGQQQAIKARPVNGSDEVETIFGNTRVRAGNLIVNGYKDGKGKDVDPNPDFKLRVEVGEFTDEEAFASNVVENAHRKACSAIDNMYNQEKLRSDYAMTDAAIARLYGQDQAWVNRLKGLQQLPQGYLDAIHTGKLTISAAFLLTGKAGTAVREANAYEELWMLLKDDNGDNPNVAGDTSIGSTDMANAIKEWTKKQRESAETAEAANAPASGEASTPAEGTASGEASTPTDGTTATAGVVAIPKTLKQVKDDFKKMTERTDCPETIQRLGNLFVQYIKGELEFGSLIEELFHATGGHGPVAVGPQEAPQDAPQTPPTGEPQGIPEGNPETPPQNGTDENGPVNDPPASEHGVDRPVTRKRQVARKG